MRRVLVTIMLSGLLVGCSANQQAGGRCEALWRQFRNEGPAKFQTHDQYIKECHQTDKLVAHLQQIDREH